MTTKCDSEAQFTYLIRECVQNNDDLFTRSKLGLELRQQLLTSPLTSPERYRVWFEILTDLFGYDKSVALHMADEFVKKHHPDYTFLNEYDTKPQSPTEKHMSDLYSQALTHATESFLGPYNIPNKESTMNFTIRTVELKAGTVAQIIKPNTDIVWESKPFKDSKKKAAQTRAAEAAEKKLAQVTADLFA